MHLLINKLIFVFSLFDDGKLNTIVLHLSLFKDESKLYASTNMTSKIFKRTYIR